MRKLAVLTIVPLLLGCGDDDPLAPKARYETVVRIEGTVRSAADSTPIYSATVFLNHFVSPCWDWVCEPARTRTPTPNDGDLTDANGAYSLQVTVKHETAECMWGYTLSASGYGHERSVAQADLQCVEILQTYDFWLNPE